MNRSEAKKKATERAYLERFLELSGRTAKIEDSERPDFLLSEADGHSGIEVTQALRDESASGSLAKSGEQLRKRFLTGLASHYYRAGGEPVLVKTHLPSRPGNDLAEQLVPRLVGERRNMSPGDRSTFFLNEKSESQPVYLTALPSEMALYSQWQCINDRVDLVRDLTAEVLAGIIASKAAKLAEYQKTISRVALLIVADRIDNSGKFQLPSTFQLLPASGFDGIYLLAYPLSVHTIA